MMNECKVMGDGNVHLPENVQKHLNLEQGDVLHFEKAGNGTVVMSVRRTSIKKMSGLLKQKSVTRAAAGVQNSNGVKDEIT